MSRDREDPLSRIVAEAVMATGFELVDFEVTGRGGRTLISVFIDKEGGVNHGDCARASRILGEFLEAGTGPGLGSYILEVSSPGVDRPLKSPGDFKRFVGETARITSRTSIGGRTHHLGTIEGVTEQGVVLRDPDLGTVEIPFAEVRKARLRRDPWAPARSRPGGESGPVS